MNIKRKPSHSNSSFIIFWHDDDDKKKLLQHKNENKPLKMDV